MFSTNVSFSLSVLGTLCFNGKSEPSLYTSMHVKRWLVCNEMCELCKTNVVGCCISNFNASSEYVFQNLCEVQPKTLVFFNEADGSIDQRYVHVLINNFSRMQLLEVLHNKVILPIRNSFVEISILYNI